MQEKCSVLITALIIVFVVLINIVFLRPKGHYLLQY